MESFAGKLTRARQIESVFIVKKLEQGGCALVLRRSDERQNQHICDFRSEAEAKIWIRENAAKFIDPGASG